MLEKNVFTFGGAKRSGSDGGCKYFPIGMNAREPPDTKTPKKPNGKKLGTYSPTEAVAQPLGVEGKKSIDG